MTEYQKRKMPLLAAILSFFIPGLGQLYDGKFLRGLMVFIVYLVLWGVVTAVYVFGVLGGMLTSVITFGATLGLSTLCCMPILFVPIIYNLWAAYDAHKIADRINRGMA
jgi:hypothetical protein